MSEDEDGEWSSDADFEELMESIREKREERQEQVSFEWVETVREAGELWRDVGNVETVAEEANLSLETMREALTVYRLIFENPSDVAMKALRPSRVYFSLEGEVGDEVDEEDEDEPVKDLIREYVGALYLDHDICELPVGEPPDEEMPPTPVDWKELSETLSQSFSIPGSTKNAVANLSQMNDIVLESQLTAVENAIDPDLFPTEQMVTDAIQPLIDHRQQMIANAVQPLTEQREQMTANAVKPLIEHRQGVLAQSLAPLTAALEHQQNSIAQSTAVMISETIQDITFPSSVLADLAAVQPSISAAATASTHLSSRGEESVVDRTSTTSAEVELLDATVETGPETVPTYATVDSMLPDTSAFSTELTLEIPTQITYFILSGSETREWFIDLPANYQRAAISVIIGSIAYSLTLKWGAAGFAATALTPLIRQMLLKE